MQQDRKPLKLSPREHDLIIHAAQGLTDTAIAYKLGISEATVGTYWGRVRIKIGPFNRTELVSIYLRAEQEEQIESLRRENEIHIQEIRDASQISEDVEKLFREIIENAPDAMLLVSESGMIDSANAAAHELFHYPAGELNGIRVSNLVPERFRELHDEHREEYLESPQRRQMGSHLETPALCADGTEILVRASLSAIPTPVGMIVTCAVRAAESD